jgi:hypothetical protein
MAKTHRPHYRPSEWETLASKLSKLRSDRIKLNDSIAQTIRRMEAIENRYRARHPELTDDEFEALLKRDER